MGGRGRSRPTEGYYSELPEGDKKGAAAAAAEEEEEDDEATMDLSDAEEETADLESGGEEEGEEEYVISSGRGRGRGRKRGRPLGSKKKPGKLPGAPDRPQNAFMLYLADYRSTHADEISNIPVKDVSKLVGERWKALTEQEKTIYEERAEKEREAYQVALAEFKEENPNVQRKKRRKKHPDEPMKKS